MGAGAWLMLAFGAIFLWGGLVAAIINYLRVRQAEKEEGNDAD